MSKQMKRKNIHVENPKVCAKYKPKIKADTSLLPYDVIEIILSRLPVKSVLRFKSVSKSWNAITSNQRFARMHLDNTRKISNYSDDTHDIFLWQSHVTEKYQLAEFDNNQNKFRLIKPPFKFPLTRDYYKEDYDVHQQQVLCTCDGFLLLKKNCESHNCYVLWNPTTNAYTLFFCPYQIELKKTSHGMCYDSSNDDYKVVIVTKKYYAVFSYKNNTWTQREFLYTGISDDPGIFVNGRLYWVAVQRPKEHKFFGGNHGRFLAFDGGDYGDHTYYRQRTDYEFDGACTHEIIYFDPIDDEFKEFHLPDGLKEEEFKFRMPGDVNGGNIVYLTTLKGCLCLYQNAYDRSVIRLWLLEDGLWTEFISIEDLPRQGIWPCDLVKPLCLTNNDEIVLQFFEYNRRFPESRFIIYSYMKKKNKYSKFRKFCIGAHSHAITCLSNLVLPTRNTKSRYTRHA